MRASNGAERPDLSLSLAPDPSEELKRGLDQAVRAAMETYQATKKIESSGDHREGGSYL